jgi:hypothetical protein
MTYNIIYAEYMEYDEDIEAVSIEEAKRKFEDAVSSGEIEPVQARVMEYQVEPNV